MQEVFLKKLANSACKKHWKKIGVYPHHGFILMLSSIHSERSLGSGEFLDLIPLINWAKKIGLDFIQLLPLNDSGNDNSPYNPISVFALNPIYLNLPALPHVENDEELMNHIALLKEDDYLKVVNYSKVRKEKLEFFNLYYQKYFSQFSNTKSYQKFFKKHTWLFDYALFNVLSEINQSTDWGNWPTRHQYLTSIAKDELIVDHLNRVHFYIFLQYLCFKQLESVKQFADDNSFFLFGDLPFLVSKQSCDAWQNPDLFLMDTCVGSPPDDMTPDGQNWNFPAYNWKELKKTNYDWWRQRLKVSEHFFHLYRLDHIIGFFRTWNIPMNASGHEGSFYPLDPATWLDHGKQFLMALIKNSSMLPIGEDLVIPQTIKDTLHELGICGTNILPWQRTGAGGLDFVPYPLYVAATITHIASHDTATLAQWWHNYPKVSQAFAMWRGLEHSSELSLKNRFEILRDSHHTSSLFHSNLLSEYLALFPKMVHSDYNLERINYPGTASGKNWRLKLIPTIEEIIASKELFETFKKIID